MDVEEKSEPMIEIISLKYTYFGIDGQPLLGSTFLIDDISFGVGDLAGIPTIWHQIPEDFEVGRYFEVLDQELYFWQIVKAYSFLDFFML